MAKMRELKELKDPNFYMKILLTIATLVASDLSSEYYFFNLWATGGYFFVTIAFLIIYLFGEPKDFMEYALSAVYFVLLVISALWLIINWEENQKWHTRTLVSNIVLAASIAVDGALLLIFAKKKP